MNRPQSILPRPLRAGRVTAAGLCLFLLWNLGAVAAESPTPAAASAAGAAAPASQLEIHC